MVKLLSGARIDETATKNPNLRHVIQDIKMQLTSSAGVKQNGMVEKYPMQVFGKEDGSWVIFLLGCEDFFLLPLRCMMR